MWEVMLDSESKPRERLLAAKIAIENALKYEMASGAADPSGSGNLDELDGVVGRVLQMPTRGEVARRKEEMVAASEGWEGGDG